MPLSLDLLDLAPTIDPMFGRKKLSNVYLTPKGAESNKRLLLVIQKMNKDIVYCRMLPRVS